VRTIREAPPDDTAGRSRSNAFAPVVKIFRRPLRHQQRVFLQALLTAVPATGTALVLLWSGDPSPWARWSVTLVLVAAPLMLAAALRGQVVRPLQTLANLLFALRRGDFAVRAAGARGDDALGLALMEANALSTTLREQRLGTLEATALLRTVMNEIDVAVFAFSADRRLRLVNRTGERLMAHPAERTLGLDADELGLAVCLRGAAPRTFSHAFPGGSGRWEVRRSTFRQGGQPHELLVLTDLSHALREEERQAWQRLVRVLSHEINNSLAPIHSIAGSLLDLLRTEPPPGDRDEDLNQGLAVIAGRSAALSRFMSAYARLARLPPPRFAPVDVGTWVRRVARLETRVPVGVHDGPPITLQADGDQLDQLLINLVRNGADAALETGGGVAVRWTQREDGVVLCVDDEGPGVESTDNLFVPFFTTKPTGTGIGLALSRQIVEAHGGTIVLENRADSPGARVELFLPLRSSGGAGGEWE
jgi:two-component system nitrogen regulation sensor histidine kinase NtrY